MKSPMRIATVILIGVMFVGATACIGSDAQLDPQPSQVPGQSASPKPEPTTSAAAVAKEAPAPIDSVNLEYRTGDAGQSVLVVESGLPNSCYEFGTYAMDRADDVIRVQVTNLDHSRLDTACAEIYRTVTTRIDLGGDIEACQVYTVEVNGLAQLVQAIGPAIRCAAPDATPPTQQAAVGVPFALRLEETLTIGTDGLKLRFDRVLEESRCPVNVTCIWAGRTRIQLTVTKDGEGLGLVELTLGAGSEDESSKTMGGYRIEILALDPYPGTDASSSTEDAAVPTVTLLVSTRK